VYFLQLEDFIGCASHLERPCFLQIFAFEVYLSPTELVYEVAGQDWRLVDVRLDSVMSLENVLVCWDYH
jgi:hypothetical protein